MRASRVISSALFSRCLPLLQSGTTSAPPTEAPDAACKRLEAQIAEMRKAIDAAKTESLYSAAEADNTRKAAAANAEAAKLQAKEEFAADMLDPVDALEKNAKTTRQLLKENADIFSPKAQKILEGVELSYRVMEKVLKRHAVEKMGIEVGTKFDPEREVSIFACPATDAVPENYVAEVVKDGFLCNGKIIRKAQVGVGEAPENPSSTSGGQQKS